MSKKSKKKKHIYTYEERTAAKSAVINQAKKFNFRLAFTMLGIFVIMAGIYALCIHLRVFWITPLFYLLTAAIFLAFFFINRGFSRTPVSAEMLPSSWSQEKKNAFVEDDIKRKAFAKKIMVVLVPMLIIVGIDILITIVIPLY